MLKNYLTITGDTTIHQNKNQEHCLFYFIFIIIRSRFKAYHSSAPISLASLMNPAVSLNWSHTKFRQQFSPFSLKSSSFT